MGFLTLARVRPFITQDRQGNEVRGFKAKLSQLVKLVKKKKKDINFLHLTGSQKHKRLELVHQHFIQLEPIIYMFRHMLRALM